MSLQLWQQEQSQIWLNPLGRSKAQTTCDFLKGWYSRDRVSPCLVKRMGTAAPSPVYSHPYRTTKSWLQGSSEIFRKGRLFSIFPTTEHEVAGIPAHLATLCLSSSVVEVSHWPFPHWTSWISHWILRPHSIPQLCRTVLHSLDPDPGHTEVLCHS